MSTISVNDASQFRNKLLQLRRDKSSIVTSSKIMEKKAQQGEAIVLKGGPRFVLILYSIFLLIVGAMVSVWYFGFNLIDWNTIIIVFSVWFGSGAIYLGITMSHMIIFHPEGFLTRRLFFINFSQKWKFLTQPPLVSVEIDSEGGRWYMITFFGPWGKKGMKTSFLKIKDIRKNEEKMNLIGKLAQIYYEKSQKL